MITNTGKDIISKYLLGYAPAYASYMAIGCGKKPAATGDPAEDYSNKQNLDFEMFRVPISSRGFINEDGISKIVFTSELPTEERYEITEIGIYSAGSNPSAGANDSKTVFAFSGTENWQRHTSVTAEIIPTIPVQLDSDDDNVITGEYTINPTSHQYDPLDGVITTTPVFQTNADNSIFYKSPRTNRYERCRFLNNTILMSGNDADLEMVAGNVVINSGSNHIHLTGINTNFAKNSPADELRLAFSVVNKDSGISNPDSVLLVVEFAATEMVDAPYARFEVELINGTGPGEYDFSSNRYFVVSKQLQDLNLSSGFTWDSVTTARIYACARDGGVASDNFYIALDAMRLENVNTINPLYGLTGYSVIKNATAETVVKSPNTTNYIEFRFAIDTGAIV